MAAELEFDGGAADYLGVGILAFIVTVFSFGICFPWALVMKERWRVEHTKVNGKRLKFNGTAWSLFGLWIKNIVFIWITLGIYSFWVIPGLEKWKVENTSF